MKNNAVVISLLLCICSPSAFSQSSLLNLVQFSSGYSLPLDIQNCGDSRLFIVQQRGRIFICDSLGNKNSTAFLDIGSKISFGGERGLLGLAFDPNYLTNGYFYVDYTDLNGNTQISRFSVSSDPNKADAASEKKILSVIQPYENHNGGCIRFGKDGYLYIGMGDGGSGGDPSNNAQNPNSLLGKMLRIDVHNGDPYSIPPDNPFVNTAGYKKEIWAMGMRNPWRYSFDALTGDLWIGDVGQDQWEEIDMQPGTSNGGENYGWRCAEGRHAYNTSGCLSQNTYTFPVIEYQHLGSTGDCSVTGGFVYRGQQYPEMYGVYLFCDYCSGRMRAAIKASGNRYRVIEVANKEDYAYTTFGENNKNELYTANYSTGVIYHLQPSSLFTSSLQNGDSENEKRLHIYPNPSNGKFEIQYTAVKAVECRISVHDNMGKEIYSTERKFSAGLNAFSISLTAAAKGNCYVSLSNSSGKICGQWIIVE